MNWTRQDSDPWAELQQEKSRDHHLAADAAFQLVTLTPLKDIPTEPLEALYAMLGFELEDRDRREKIPQPELF